MRILVTHTWGPTMNYKIFFLQTFAALLLMSSLTALADYRYTYTSGPVNEVSGTPNLEPDDFMKIVIETTAAPMTQGIEYRAGANPQGYFYEATYIEMSLGAFTLRSNEVEWNVYTSFFINEYDVNGLPTNWNMNFVSLPNGAPCSGCGFFEQIQLTSYGQEGDSHNSLSRYFENPTGFYFESAIAQGSGTWSLEQISSPVPENETYAMMFAGLGLIGFVNRKRRKST